MRRFVFSPRQFNGLTSEINPVRLRVYGSITRAICVENKSPDVGENVSEPIYIE